MSKEKGCHWLRNRNACQTVHDSSLFKTWGSYLTLAKTTYLVDRNSLEEFLPPLKVSNFLHSALVAHVCRVIKARHISLAIIWSGNRSFQEVPFHLSYSLLRGG